MPFNRLVFLFLLPILVHARPGYFEPWGKDAELTQNTWQHPPAETPLPQSFLVRAAEKVISFHQNVLSPVDGPRSHFYPSSSQYMRLAMRKHGFIKGFFLGCDRLMRENNAEWVYRTVQVEDGRILKYDPVPD